MKKKFLFVPIIISFALFIFLAFESSNQNSSTSVAKEPSTENNLISPKAETAAPDSTIGEIDNQENKDNLDNNSPTGINQLESETNSINSNPTDTNNSTDAPGYTLSGDGCQTNQIPSTCDLQFDNQNVLNLKECAEVEVNTNCNLYSYSVQKEEADKLYVFKEYTDDKGVVLLEVLEVDKNNYEPKIITSVINDKSISQSLVDYDKAYNSYKK